jgi:hypothetical protein
MMFSVEKLCPFCCTFNETRGLSSLLPLVGHTAVSRLVRTFHKNFIITRQKFYELKKTQEIGGLTYFGKA